MGVIMPDGRSLKLAPDLQEILRTKGKAALHAEIERRLVGTPCSAHGAPIVPGWLDFELSGPGAQCMCGRAKEPQ